jgi:isocitrate dehydrogenase (NAD+)
MTRSDGLFLQCCGEVAKRHPTVSYREILLDHCCMELARDPRLFDVLLLQNIDADNVSGLCAGVIGGLGLVPSAALGHECAMFETMHGSAPDIAGKGIANPTALILSGVLMLRHVGLHKDADRIERAIRSVIARREVTTPDLGGHATTKDFTQAVIDALHEPAEEPLAPLGGERGGLSP